MGRLPSPFHGSLGLLLALGALAPAARCAVAVDTQQDFAIALPPGPNDSGASLRESAVLWYPAQSCYYLVADVVPLDSSHHPNTYETGLHLWRSRDLADWTHLGTVVPVGSAGRFDAHGAASPAGMAIFQGAVYVAYSARKTAAFTQRGIGIAFSGDDPNRVPWTRLDRPVSDPPGEDDDPALVTVPGDDRLHLYHRTTGGPAGYRIVHTASRTPQIPESWDDAVDVTVRPEGVRAQELTGAIWLDGRMHLFVIEQGPGVTGIRIAHLVGDGPEGPFEAVKPGQRYLDYVPARVAYGGHFTPVLQDGKLVAAFWTVFQDGPRYGLLGHPVRWAP